MSDFKVPYTKILDIQPHSNADRLALATVYGFQVIVQKDRYKIGDPVVYIPVDSILPKNIENTLFPEGSKIVLHKSRVRQVRIRKLASQGMLVDPKDLSNFINFDYVNLEDDLSAILGISKYDPPVVGPSVTLGGPKNRNKKTDNPNFHKYNGLNNVKWFPDFFKDGESVCIQEKCHGTNARAAIMPYVANTLWKKIKRFLGLVSEYENCYGSNNVEISSTSGYKGFYGQDIYGLVFAKLDVFNKIKPGEAIYGEIIGPGIQKGYDYGLNEHRFVLFDVKVLQADGKQKWLSPKEVRDFAADRGLDIVPVLYEGPYNKEFTYTLTRGKSQYDPNTKVREGIVIKSQDNYDEDGNKRALKWINEEYLDDTSNSDFH